jgi:hypothetical protein
LNSEMRDKTLQEAYKLLQWKIKFCCIFYSFHKNFISNIF